MKRFYFIISFLGDDINESFLVGRCLKILHGFYYRQEITDIGVSFPEWSNVSIGKRIAFVSSNASSLKFLATQKYFTEMEQLNYFAISKMGWCLLDSSNSAIFSRNQKGDSYTTLGRRRNVTRLKKRAEKRGEIYKPKANVYGASIIPFCHKIPISSNENKNDYTINIEKKVFCELNENTFNSYGLSTSIESINPVPIIFNDV
jgi:CRISPR-associated endonuclease Csy4